MATKLHEALVDDVIASTPGAERYKFSRAVANLVGGVDVLREEGAWPTHVVPDAFVIEGKTVTAYEIEVHSNMSDVKLVCYADLWCALDVLGFELKLVRVSSTGHRVEFDIGEHDERLREAHRTWVRDVFLPYCERMKAAS